MSHNANKIGNATADRVSEIDVGVDDLADVSASSPSLGDVLVWGGASWGTGGLLAAGSEMIFIGDGASNAYYTSGSNPGAGVDVNIHDLAPINTIVGATVNVEASPPAGQNWITSVTLPAGTYQIDAKLALTFSITDTATFNFHDGSSYFGTTAVFGSSDFETGIVNRSIITLAGSTTLTLRIVAGTNINTTAAQGTRQSERAFFTILKST